jgi:UDP-glucose 4-epimerase
MSRYLITGGLGLIGTELARTLVAAGHQIRIIDNLSSGQQNTVSNDCEVIIGNVNDNILVGEAMAGVDGCFHLATSNESSGQDNDDLNCNNLQGMINVLSAARAASTRSALPVVYASSSITYGDNAHTSLGEDLTARPLTSAAADKVGIELRARVATLAHGIPTTGLRLFSVYGQTADGTAPVKGVIATFMERILNGQAITIYGDGEQTRDFVYLTDVVNFFTAAMTLSPHQPALYNVCTGRQTSLQQLAHLLFSLLGKPVEIRYAAARKGDIRSSVGNPEMAIRHLGIRARTTLASGMKQILAGRSGNTAFSKRSTTPGTGNLHSMLKPSTVTP